MLKKAILSSCMVLLFIGVCLLPVSAKTSTIQNEAIQEVSSLDMFMDEVERIAATSQTFQEFTEKLQNFCNTINYGTNVILRDMVQKMLQLLLKERGLYLGGINIFEIINKFSALKQSPSYFVISYGAYNRINPMKENSVEFFKERFSMWRYSDVANLLKGRTIVLERQPFGIHQRVTGPQIGFMRGFKGIYLDLESRLTGNAYVFFTGRVNRIRAFDLTPFK